MQIVSRKTQDELNAEWDRIAELRSQQIRCGKDISYQHLLVPTVIDLCATLDRTSVVDVGCGCGFLTERLAEESECVLGIDPSKCSIDLARRNCGHLTNTAFRATTIEDYAKDVGQTFTLVVANMSLMAMLDLPAALESISRVLRPDGHVVFTITHPCFWSRYWHYSDEWFVYDRELIIEAPFVISLDKSHSFVTTHVHRPLRMYFDCLSGAGLVVSALKEPWPSQDVEQMYPNRWRYPRFLAVVCEKPLDEPVS